MMPSVWKTAAAAVVGFAVGAGASAGVFTMVDGSHVIAQVEQTGAAGTVRYSAPSSGALAMGPSTISDVVQRVSPAVVKIVATVPQQLSISSSPFFNPFFGSLFGSPSQTQVATDIGSGFFFNSHGYLLTNDHVIQGATRVQVDVPGYRKPLPATVIGTDHASDLAVLRVHLNKPAAVLTFGNSTATPVGAWAIAIGNPYNLYHTVTVGVISAKGRPLTIGNRQYRNLLQTSAAINPGNSGGPLLNLAGQVVGINTAVESQGQGIGFAIPTTTVEQILPQLMKARAPRPWIGAYIATDSPAMAAAYNLAIARGVVITEVDPQSPAAAAGLSAGDVITRVNHIGIDSASQLRALVLRAKVGAQLRFTVDDNGSTKVRSVVVGENPNTGAPPTLPGG